MLFISALPPKSSSSAYKVKNTQTVQTTECLTDFMKSVHDHVTVNTILLNDSKLWISTSECESELGEVWEKLKDRLKLVCATDKAGNGRCRNQTEQSRWSLVNCKHSSNEIFSFHMSEYYFKIA